MKRVLYLIKMVECAKVFVILFAGLVVQCLAMSLSELEDFANFLKKTSQLDETLKKGTDVHDFDEDDAVSDHAWEESGKFEGDLILNERQRRTIVEDIAEGLSRNGLRDSTKRWPDNEVIYFIQKEHFSGDQIQAIQNGIDDLAQASCVKFRPYRKGDRDAVVIQGSRRGCFSQVGYQGGYQVLNLSGRHPVGRGCFRHGTVVHELLHTLGFYHMQSSPDRDDYVDIAWENIVQPARHNFRKYNAFSVSDFGVGYDYDSVLHYSRRAFSSNGRDTILPKQGGAEIGQRVGLSDKDTQKLNKMYCDADSNDNAGDDVPQKSSNKKKNHKNKPFDGHGIGYHQGKTVVIKLLPTAEVYHVINKPAFPMFDYFSKTPQVLSPKESEGFGSGKRVADFYKPDTYVEHYNNQDRKETQESNGLKAGDTNNEGNSDDSATKTEEETSKTNNSAQSLSGSEKENSGISSVEENDELSDAFKRLAKILKTHVYPTHVPDLKPFKINTNYSEFEDPKKIPKIAYDFVSTISKEGNRDSSESEYIKSLYNNVPDTLSKEVKIYPNKLEKVVDDQNAPTETQNKSHGKEYAQNTENKSQHTDTDHSSIPQIQKKAFENPKEMYEVLVKYSVPKESDATYRTSYPFKIHQVVSNGSLELKTPDYALYENLKDKNNYSGLYEPSSHENYDDEESKRQYTTFGKTVPTYNNWYQKDYLKRNPVDYDRPSYTYALPGTKSDIRIYDISESSEHDPDYGSEYTGSYSPQTKQPYVLYDEPVPLTQDWYKVNSQKLIEYPYNHYQPKDYSESHEDKR